MRAQTEVLKLELQPERTYVWWLPGGSYSLLTATDASGCEHRSRFDVVCPYPGPRRSRSRTAPRSRFEITTAAGAAMPTLHAGVDAAAPAFEEEKGRRSRSRNGADELLVTTSELVTFESQPVEQWRIPLMVERVQIGESLSDSVVASDCARHARRANRS